MNKRNEITSFHYFSCFVSIVLLVTLILIMLPFKVSAHSGGLNSRGCHSGSKPYHCHRSSNEMVGNRLRCDLGSDSTECRNGNRSNKQAGSNPTSTNNNKTKPRKIDFSADALTIFGVGFDLGIEDAKKILTNRFSCSEWRKNSLTSSGYSFECIVKDGGEPVEIKTDKLGRIDSFLFACETFGGCAYTPEQIYAAFRSQMPVLGQPQTKEKTICDEGKLGEKICFWDFRKYIAFYRNKFKQKSLIFD